MNDTSAVMADLWSASAAITELLVRQVYVVLGVIVLGFVVLEALYVLGLGVWLSRRRPPRREARGG